MDDTTVLNSVSSAENLSPFFHKSQGFGWVLPFDWHICAVWSIYFFPFVFPSLFCSLSQRIPALTAEWDTMTSLLCHSCCMALKAQWQHLLCSMETVAATSCESQVCYWSPFSAGVSERGNDDLSASVNFLSHDSLNTNYTLPTF